MTNKMYALDRDGFRRLAEAIVRSERTPRGGSRRRRRWPIMSPTVTNGGGPGSCCAGCDPFNCDAGTDVPGCDVCPTSSGTWNVLFPSSAFEDCVAGIGGVQVLDHYAACTWRGPDVTVGDLTSRWELSLGEDVSTLTFNLGPYVGQICYHLYGPFCCLCEQEFRICCGPHPACIHSFPQTICVSPGGGAIGPYPNVNCGGLLVPGMLTVTAPTFGTTGSLFYDPTSQTWTGKVQLITGGSCVRNFVYVTVSCINGQLQAAGNPESNTQEDMCGTSNAGSGDLTGTSPNWGSFDVLTGPDCCVASGSTVTLEITGSPL
jgi:hypothetical protein